MLCSVKLKAIWFGKCRALCNPTFDLRFPRTSDIHSFRTNYFWLPDVDF